MDDTPKPMTCCEKVSKKGLITLNSVCIFGGILAIIGGLIIKINVFTYTEHLAVGNLKSAAEFLATAPILILLLGVVVVIISFCGCCGACLEKVWLLKIYKVILIAVLAALVVLAGLSFAFKTSVQKGLQVVLRNFLQTYESTSEVMDLIQGQLDCCGIDSSMDWQRVEEWKIVASENAFKLNLILGTNPVPDSCCVESYSDREGCGLGNSFRFNSTTVHTDGCSSILWKVLSSNGELVGLSGLILAGLLLLCVIFTCSVVAFIDESQGRSYAA